MSGWRQVRIASLFCSPLADGSCSKVVMCRVMKGWLRIATGMAHIAIHAAIACCLCNRILPNASRCIIWQQPSHNRCVCGRLDSRGQQSIKANFDCTFDIPKFQILCDFERSLLWLGNTDLTSSDFGERTHCDVKWPVPYSNNHKEDRLRQVCCTRLYLSGAWPLLSLHIF